MSGGLLAVLPIITHDYADACVASILKPQSASGFDAADLLIVDNTRAGSARYGLRTHRDPDGHNLGVARSWNVGAREVLERGLDYLVIVSASMLFGPILHTTWTRQMETFWGENVIEADGHSWHLIAFHRRVFEGIGLFDENLYPAYFEAQDFSFRMRQVGWEGGWTRVWVNALSQGHALHNQVVNCPADPLLEYMRTKWGGNKHEETFTQPFGDRPLDWWPEATIPELAKRYDLGERGVGWW